MILSRIGMVAAMAFRMFLVEGSPGDDLYAFDDCLFQCEQITCQRNPYHLWQQEFRQELVDTNPEFEFTYYNDDWHFDAMPLPWYLRALLWDCRQNCDYQCQRTITRERKHNHEEVYQFHGKWPFLRVLGVQEFVSMVFSLGNLYVHVVGFQRVWRATAVLPLLGGSRYAVWNILVVSGITICAWVFSTIFHIRDFWLTEKLDYYFAGLTVLSGFHLIGSRLMNLASPANVRWRWVFGAGCALAYAGHVVRLVVDWLYTYNMQANVAVGLLQNVCLCLLCYSLYCKYYDLENRSPNVANLSHLNYIDFGRIILPSFYARSPKLYSLYPLLLSTIVIVGMSLEIFDFPPVVYDLVDAHSLWHLVTIFPAYLGWYDWMVWDVAENVVPDIARHAAKKND